MQRVNLYQHNGSRSSKKLINIKDLLFEMLEMQKPNDTRCRSVNIKNSVVCLSVSLLRPLLLGFEREIEIWLD